jgi:hypothetical protein
LISDDDVSGGELGGAACVAQFWNLEEGGLHFGEYVSVLCGSRKVGEVKRAGVGCLHGGRVWQPQEDSGCGWSDVADGTIGGKKWSVQPVSTMAVVGLGWMWLAVWSVGGRVVLEGFGLGF